MHDPLVSDAALVDELVRATRCLGADPALVLHGGGNSSVKADWTGVDGMADPALIVKGSGHDMRMITAEGFAPLDLRAVRRLLPPTVVHPDAVMPALMAARLDCDSPTPSVETLVHAALPARFVLHSHADAVLAVTDSADGRAAAARVWGDSVAVLEYAAPGYPLGAAVAELVASWRGSVPVNAIVVLGHGVFAFADTAEDALAAHDATIAAALAALREHDRPELSTASSAAATVDPRALSAFRSRISDVAGVPLLVTAHTHSPIAALRNGDLDLLLETARGVATPDHVTWTGPYLALDCDLDAYAERYASYLSGLEEATQPAAFPKAVADDELGFVTVGATPAETAAVAEIVEHTAWVARAARSFGGYRPPAPEHVRELEMWSAQRAKTHRRHGGGPHAGKIALVTGAASGIGRAIALSLLQDGAAVAAWDISPTVVEMSDSDRWLGQVVDVTEADAQERAIDEIVRKFGGLDILVPAAGIFPAAKHLSELDDALWARTLAINVTSVQTLFRLAHPFLIGAPRGGRVIVIASKNVAAPGPGAAAYSASKAALNQLARIAALEWAGDGVRVNVVNPDAVFDTGLWTPELLAQRAAHYGVTVEAYKRRNLLHTEVTSAQIGRLVSVMASSIFDSVTGAQVPIDGGNERVI